MPKLEKKKSFLARAREWGAKHKLFGPQAFLRYVMLTFLERLAEVSDDFVFKGGNLLWVYIGTPRMTVDLDLATLTIGTHKKAREVLEKACGAASGVQFSIQKFEEIENQGHLGAAVTVEFKTADGAKNSFDIDVVYTLETDTENISSPLGEGLEIPAASLENIVADKFAALHRFGAGTSRMKDIDDLWRISNAKVSVDAVRLARILDTREIVPSVELNWINEGMEKAWASHQRRYPDLPEKITKVFEKINSWAAKKVEKR